MNSEKVNDKLKPCPFCGGKPYDNYTDTFGYWYITCINCHAQIHARKRKEAIESWNRRETENGSNNL